MQAPLSRCVCPAGAGERHCCSALASWPQRCRRSSTPYRSPPLTTCSPSAAARWQSLKHLLAAPRRFLGVVHAAAPILTAMQHRTPKVHRNGVGQASLQ